MSIDKLSKLANDFQDTHVVKGALVVGLVAVVGTAFAVGNTYKLVKRVSEVTKTRYGAIRDAVLGGAPSCYPLVSDLNPSPGSEYHNKYVCKKE